MVTVKIPPGLPKHGFTLALLVLFLCGAHVQMDKMGEIGFNYFHVPENDELYLLEYGSSDVVLHSSSARSCFVCNQSVQIAPGDNPIDVRSCPEAVTLECDGRSVWFVRQASEAPEYFNGSALYSLNGQELTVVVSGSGSTNGFRQMAFFIDGKKVLAPAVRLDGPFEISERLTPGLGAHSLKVEFLGRTIGEEEFHVQRPYPLSLMFSGVLSIILSALLLRRASPTHLLVALGMVFSVLVFHFQLEALGAWWLMPVFLMASVAYVKTNGAVLELPSIGWGYALAITALFTAYILSLNLLVGNFDIWSAYYNRHADMTLQNWSPFYYDSLSYLGRQSTYPSAFFDLAASVGGLIQASDFTSFRLPFHIFLASVFALSTYAVFHRFSRRSAAMATAFILLQWFFTMTATTLSLHTFSYIMLNLSLIASLPLSSAFLAVAFATHPITIFVYPFYLYASKKFKIDLKNTVLTLSGAVAVSLFFYLPIFLTSGLPYEIVPTRWGYFFTYGLNGMHFEFLLFLPLLFLSFAAVLKKGYRIPAMLVAFFAVVNAFVLYRVNVILAVMFAALFPLAFEKELKDNRNAALVLAFVLANVIITPVIHSGTTDWCTWGIANDMCVSPMRYIERYTPTGDTIAIDPIYGHLETYVGKRPVLADLYVEYADLDKFEAEDLFHNTGNLDPSRGYNVSLAVEDEVIWPQRPDRKNLTMEDGDRIYDNGFMHVTRIRD